MDHHQAASLLSPGELEDFIGYRLRLAQIAAYRNFEGSLTRHGSAPRYLGLLAIIERNPGQPQSRLAEAIALKRSSLVPIIDKLEAERLIERRTSASDRRYKSVWLTSKGRRVLTDLTSRARVQEERLGKGLSAEERETLLRLLGTVLENLRPDDGSVQPETARGPKGGT